MERTENEGRNRILFYREDLWNLSANYYTFYINLPKCSQNLHRFEKEINTDWSVVLLQTKITMYVDNATII